MPVPAPSELAEIMAALGAPERDVRASHHRVIVRARHAEHRVAVQLDGALEPLRARFREWCPDATETKRGDAVLRRSLFRWDERSLQIAQSPAGGLVELALQLGPSRATLDEALAVVAPITELRPATAFVRALAPSAFTAVVSLAEGWTPNAYLELDVDPEQLTTVTEWLTTQPLRPTAEGEWRAENAPLFATLSFSTSLRIGISPSPQAG